ncbi:MAG: DNA mismatch repair endonuclease MutL [Lachnospiraceae bacterium]|nr:DNA mismatch repair endonuclease MutL [Lachnospiraceae bacterium]
MIRILDNLTINKIAAGEVIERPFNVVKELVENSIDAGSKHISVEIKGGGIDYIRVTDDGSGIPYEDVPTAFLRHATSKIVTSEDLFFLNTLGFRGEALASIASVSHTEMITKVPNELMGTKIDLDCGSVIELSKTGAPEGTTIIVRDLFFNVPARKKFLNSPSSEATRIIELMEELVLSHPSIGFQLLVNGAVKIQSNGSGNIKDIIYRLYGKEIHDALIPMEYEDDFIKVSGFITKPEICRPSRSGENYFINGRYVKNEYITRGIEEGYRNHLMQHKFPFVVLFIELDSFGLDVNVHPAKSEVRITNGEFLVEILNKTIKDLLKDNELIPNAFKFEEEKPVVERAPEPFEKSLITSHVVQKGYDSKIVVKKDEEPLLNDKSKEFTVDFESENHSNSDKPNNEFMNHITTISYKSKYNKLEERMKNGDDDNVVVNTDQSVENAVSSENAISTPDTGTTDRPIGSVTENAAVQGALTETDNKLPENTKPMTDTDNEIPKRIDDNSDSDSVNLEFEFVPKTEDSNVIEKDNIGSIAENPVKKETITISENEFEFSDNPNSQGSALLKNRVGGYVENASSYKDSEASRGSALMKNRANPTDDSTSRVKDPVDYDDKIHGSSLFKKQSLGEYDKSNIGNLINVEDQNGLTKLSLNESGENVVSKKESPNTETASEVPQKTEVPEDSNSFENWLNSIENKDTVEIEKSTDGMIVKISDIPQIKTVNFDEPEEDLNETLKEIDMLKKSSIIDRIGERRSSENDDRLNEINNFSVLDDDIAPIRTDDTIPSQTRFSFRVKDFDKDTDDETQSPIKGNVDNMFKKVDRFKSTKNEPKIKETQSVLFNEKTLDPAKLSKFKIIDQIFSTYWLITVDDELLIMDQHAAHEKVLYEKFMDKFRNGKIETQTLMLSQVVNLSKAEMDVYERYKKEFEKFGFIINDFGDKDLFIRGIPTDLFGSDAKSLFLDILSELINVSPSLHIDIIETRIATRACKAAIKGNQKISKEECQKLIEHMLKLNNPYQCPHGRPTLIRISKTDLEKMFKRIVS